MNNAAAAKGGKQAQAANKEMGASGHTPRGSATEGGAGADATSGHGGGDTTRNKSPLGGEDHHYYHD